MITRIEYNEAVQRAKDILNKAGIQLKKDDEVEIADFGLNRLNEIGLELVIIVNHSSHCGKWLVMFKGQTCPKHKHPVKAETFFCHSGKIELILPDQKIILNPGESYTIEQMTDHEFIALADSVVLEISSHSDDATDIFTDPEIERFTKIAD